MAGEPHLILYQQQDWRSAWKKYFLLLTNECSDVLFHKRAVIVANGCIYLEFWNLIGTRNGSIFAVTHLIYSTSRDLLHTAGWTFGPGILICCYYRKVLDNVFGALYLAIEKGTKLTHIVYKCISSIQYNIFVFIDFRGIHFLHVDVWMYQGVYMTNSDRNSLS